MKKLFFTAMMFALASSSFAQDILKQLKGQNYDQAVATLNAALPSLSAEQAAKGYNQIVELAYKDASKAYDALVLNQTTGKNDPVDYDALVKAIEAGVKCDPYDNQPNDKGKVAPKFHKKNCDRLSVFRTSLVNYGQSLLNKDNASALKYLGVYVNSSSASLFAEVAGDKDPYVAPVARICGLIAYQEGDYATAANYAKMALKDPAEREDAENIYVSALEKSMKTKQDTLNFIQVLKDTNPQRYFGTMASLLNRMGDTEAAAKLIDDEIAANPGNKMAWATKGEAAMNARDWEKAIEAFKKTVEIDPQFTAVWFNLGVCAYTYAADLTEKLSDKQGKITLENNEKVMSKIRDAKTYYEKTRELDPNYEAIPQWPRQLRMVYNQLGETDKAKEISRMLGDE